MSEKELRKYRLTSTNEPSDEHLKALMHAAGQEARSRWAKAEASFNNELRELVAKRQCKQSNNNGAGA